MFNYQRCIAATVIVFCLMAVVSVAATNNATTTQFMESSWSFFSPSQAQANQNVDNQPLCPRPIMDLFTAPELPTQYTNLWDFSFDLYGKPADYKKMHEDLIKQGCYYFYDENDTACGNCGPLPPGSFADPLGVDQRMNGPETPLTGQSPFTGKAWQRDPLTIIINCCGPEFLSVSEFLK